MIERKELMAKAAAWMQARGWKGKLAKQRGREQSPFEHTLIEIDIRLQVLPTLGERGGLWPARRTFTPTFSRRNLTRA